MKTDLNEITKLVDTKCCNKMFTQEVQLEKDFLLESKKIRYTSSQVIEILGRESDQFLVFQVMKINSLIINVHGTLLYYDENPVKRYQAAPQYKNCETALLILKSLIVFYKDKGLPTRYN